MSKRLIIFCYDPYPNEEWEALFTHAADIAFAVINVNSGVGDKLDPVYVAMVKRLQAANIKCLGYSSTRYGARPIEEVKAEIASWFKRYAVDGIFADEQAFSADLMPYYRRVKSACGTAQLVTNPGNIPESAYRDLDAIICVAETDQATYLTKTFPEWTRIVPDSVCHIVFSVTNAAKVMAKIDTNASGCYVYLTTAAPKPGASGPEFTIPDTIWPEPTPAPAPVEDPNWAAINLRLVAVALQAPSNSTLADVPNLAAQRMLELVQLRAQSATVRLSAVPADQLLEEIRRRLAT